MADYVVREEDGTSRIILEEGGGFLLLETGGPFVLFDTGVTQTDTLSGRRSLTNRALTDTGVTFSVSLARREARLTEFGVEVLTRSAEAEARLTEFGVEVLTRSAEAEARLTEFGVEVLTPRDGVVPVRPANDLFANQQALSGWSGSVQTTNWNEAQAVLYGSATVESGDPLAYGLHNFGNGTVWYTWTAPSNGFLSLVTSAPSSGTPIGDTVIGIYTGATLATLVEVAYNDDYYGDPYAQLYDIAVTVGTVYRIEVTGFGDAEMGAFELSWSFTTEALTTPAEGNFISFYCRLND